MDPSAHERRGGLWLAVFAASNMIIFPPHLESFPLVFPVTGDAVVSQTHGSGASVNGPVATGRNNWAHQPCLFEQSAVPFPSRRLRSVDLGVFLLVLDGEVAPVPRFAANFALPPGWGVIAKTICQAPGLAG